MIRADHIDRETIDRYLEKVSSSLGKSEVYRKLLGYLATRALAGDVPKELDIAVDVFGKDASFNSAEDAVVRVNVRSLRQRLDEYYRGAGAQDAVRIEIPKGGYRIQISNNLAPAAPATAAIPVAEPLPRTRGSTRTYLQLVVAGLVVLALGLAAGTYIGTRSATATLQSSEPGDSFVWGPVNQSKRPLTIVLGDLYLFSEVDPVSQRTRTIRDPEISSREDLKKYIGAHPEFSARLSSIETTLLPKSVALGLATVLPLVDRTARPVKVAIADELDLNDLRDRDVIYIGPLVRLGPIENLYWKSSRYRYSRESMRLEDTSTGEAYSASGSWPAQRKDYGLFATFPGPTGNRIMILSSVATDIGLLQIARSMTSMQTITELEAKLTKAGPRDGAFEVLFSATGIARTDFQAEIVAIHPLTGVHPGGVRPSPRP